LLVQDCMTATPITITLRESLQGAMELMAMKRIRHLPVLDSSGKLVGMVTDRDLRRAAPSPLFSRDPDKDQESMDTTLVERVMVRSPTTIGPNQSLQDAVRLFTDKKYGALPVVDGIRLVGIITPIDMMRNWLKAQP